MVPCAKVVPFAQLHGFFLEHLYKIPADDLSLCFGSVHALEIVKELLARVHVDQLHREGLGKDLHHWSLSPARIKP